MAGSAMMTMDPSRAITRVNIVLAGQARENTVNEQAGIWLRVSTELQDEQNQLPDNTAWCENHRYDVAEQYIVHGKSAHKSNKAFDETWARVIDDMLKGKITVLVVWKQDCLDRKLNTFQMLAQVVAAGGRVEFVTQPHLNDLTTMGGRIALKVQEEISYAESKDKSDRIRIANATIRRNGSNPGRAPWGYVSVGDKYSKHLEPTDDGRHFVPQIFERIAKGDSLATVGDWLANETGRRWWARRIAFMIHNPTYRGHRIDANGVTVHKCEALVDSTLWQRANKALAVKPGKRGPISGQSAMLTSVLFCGPCNDKGEISPMYRIRQRPPYAYYRCAGAGASRKGCGLMVRLAETDELVTDWLSQMGRPREIPQLVRGENHEAEITEVLLELAELSRRGLPDKQEDAERISLRARRDELEKLSSTPDHIEMVKTGETVGQHFRKLDEAGRRAMMLSDGIKVYATGVPFMPIQIQFSADESVDIDWASQGIST
jgi:DNA invertase Pin-like site-specific DNA recombinase